MASDQPKQDAAAPPPAPSQAAESTQATTQDPITAAATTTTTAPASAPKQTMPEFIHEDPSTAPDPDEDDLSDLDDVLDEFAATNISSSTSAAAKDAPASSGPGRPPQLPAVGASAAEGGVGPGGLFTSEDEFAKAMQAGMAELLGEFEANPDMQKQFEDLVKELGEGMGGVPQGEMGVVPEVPAVTGEGAKAPEAAAATSSKSPNTGATQGTPAAAASFEDTIRATMERMSSSNKSATEHTQKSAANPEEDFLAAMLREMESSGAGGNGLGSDEDFSKMLMGMMEQLTNKEILYEPMKELHDKFPGWMKENEGKVPKEDWERYVEQQKLVGEIVGKFEESGYADGKVEYREFIVERMQQMQAAGSPPPDLVGDMNAAQEALGDFDAGCPQQ